MYSKLKIMFNKQPHHWAFYVKDFNGNYRLISDRVCIRHTKTKNFKEVSKLLRDKEVEAAGCMLYHNFEENYKRNLVV